jgi:hypothetical protein
VLKQGHWAKAWQARRVSALDRAKRCDGGRNIFRVLCDAPRSSSVEVGRDWSAELKYCRRPVGNRYIRRGERQDLHKNAPAPSKSALWVQIIDMRSLPGQMRMSIQELMGESEILFRRFGSPEAPEIKYPRLECHQ